MFARRAAWDLSPNPLSLCLERRRTRGLPVLDLSDANPTHAGLDAAGQALARALDRLASDAAALRYEPDPRGDGAARAAIAAYHARAGTRVRPEHVILTAGTGEGYAHLFRLLADPGDLVHMPSPGYPLFEHLAGAEGVEVARYPLRPDPDGQRWRLDLGALAASLTAQSRAVLVIHPHNPTGCFVAAEDLAELRALCRERGLAILSDEVFADYADHANYAHSGAGAQSPRSALAGADAGPLHCVLSGASKLLALPQLKVAWIVVAGPESLRDEALARLEFLADAYLAVSPLTSAAMPGLMAERETIQAQLRARLAANRAWLGERLAARPGLSLAGAEAGWCAIVRACGTPASPPPDEEELALALLGRDGVLVQPGFLFDLEPEWRGRPCSHWLVSLLLEPTALARGVDALVARLERGD